MKEDYFGPKTDLPKPTPEDVGEIVGDSDQFKDLARQSRAYLSSKELGGLAKKIEKKEVSWLDKLTPADRSRVEILLKEKVAEREEIVEQVGKNYGKKALLDFDNFLSALRSGSLDLVKGDLVGETVARRALLIGDFSYAKDLEELIDELLKKREIVEDGKVFNSWQLAEMIDHGQIDDLPKFQNLRITVSNFLEPVEDYPASHDQNTREPDNVGDEWKEGTAYDPESGIESPGESERSLSDVIRDLKGSLSRFSTPSVENPLANWPEISLPGVEEFLRKNISPVEFEGKVARPNQLDWQILGRTSLKKTESGVYTISDDVYDGNFEQAEIFVPDLRVFVGRPVWEVAMYVSKTFSQDYYIPGLVYSKWLYEQKEAEVSLLGNQAKKIKKQIQGKPCQFFGSVVGCPGSEAGGWGVPGLAWIGSHKFFYDQRLDRPWTRDDNTILLVKRK